MRRCLGALGMRERSEGIGARELLEVVRGPRDEGEV